MLKQALNKATGAIEQFASARLPSNRLSGQDALFLHIDTPNASSHGSLIYLYDQSTVPGQKVRFQDILRHVEERLSASPLFKNKIQRVVGDLGYPYWVEDEGFDIDFHVRHFALPKPNDWRQFCILASRIHARAMDMTRPLWEMYVIEGLDNIEGIPKGSFAIMTKLHHAAVDGTALAELTWALHDTLGTAAQSVPVPKETEALTYYQADSGLRQTLLRIATDNLMSVSQVLPPIARVVPRLATQALRKRLAPVGDKAPKQKLEHTRFNDRFDLKRVFESVTYDLDDIKTIRAAVPGATVNDTVLAVIGGGLRRYLESKGELPKSSLIASAPINTRKDASERKTTGNSISTMNLPLGTHLADPLKRLAAVYAATTKTKEVTKAIGARELTDISKHTPPATLAFAGRAAIALVSGSPKFHCVVSNVPGPTEPLYMLGARLTYWSGVMPIIPGAGLFFAVSSYCGKLFVSPTSSPAMVPDPDFLAACLRESFAETLRGAQQSAAKRMTKSATRPAVAAGAKTKAAKAAKQNADRIEATRPGA